MPTKKKSCKNATKTNNSREQRYEDTEVRECGESPTAKYPTQETGQGGMKR